MIGNSILISRVKIGHRHRTSLGDIDGLVESIKEHGLLHPIVITPDRELICGYRRLEAYKLLKRTTIPYRELDIDEIIYAERDENVVRESLTPSDAVMIVETIEEKEKQLAKERQGKRTDLELSVNLTQSSTKRKSKEKAANAVGLTRNTLSKAQEVVKAAEKDPNKHSDLVGKMDRTGKVDGAYRELKKRKRKEDLPAKERRNVDELGTYSVIYADPPWTFEGATTPNRRADNQYPLMILEDIKSLPVEQLSNDDCVLFLWCPNSKNGEAHQVLESWGFTYKTNFVWVKDKIGLGHYNRQRHELLLVGTKGRPGTPEPENRFDSVIESPRRKHSQKPDLVYEMIEQMYPELSKIELFARTTRDGWASWGYEKDGISDV